MTTAEAAMIAYAETAAALRLEADDMQRRGMPATARKHRQWAAMLDRARYAEDMDPEPPKDPAWCLCSTCQSWLFEARWKRIT